MCVCVCVSLNDNWNLRDGSPCQYATQVGQLPITSRGDIIDNFICILSGWNWPNWHRKLIYDARAALMEQQLALYLFLSLSFLSLSLTLSLFRSVSLSSCHSLLIVAKKTADKKHRTHIAHTHATHSRTHMHSQLGVHTCSKLRLKSVGSQLLALIMRPNNFANSI